jgi:hypothetical protein
MSRYSQALLIAALFCFLFPFSNIAPTGNSSDFLQLTGFHMLSSQSYQVSKDPPLILIIPLRVQILIAILGGVTAVVMKLSRRSNLTVAIAVATSVAAVSLLALINSSPLVQLSDGHAVQPLGNAVAKLLPAFYCSLILMFAAALASWMGLQKQSQAGFRAVLPAARIAGLPSMPGQKIAPGAPGSSFCIKCGDALFPSARFCNRCGTPVPAALPSAAAMPKPAEIVPPQVASAASANAAAATLMPALSTSPAEPVVAPVLPPPSAPSHPPLRVEIPNVAPLAPQPAARQPRFSPGAKLGLAAASLILMAGLWLSFHRSVDQSGPMLAPTAISIYPATIRVAPGETVRLQATVTGGINREVQWSIQEGTPGGSVESAGATVQNGNVFMLASYKAPTAPGIYHVVVASAVDQSRKAVVQIYVSYGFLHF